jgi:hypothetical protein
LASSADIKKSRSVSRSTFSSGADGVELHVFELEDQRRVTTKVYGTDGGIALTVSAERNGSSVQVQVSGAGKPWKMILRNITEIEAAEGAKWEVDQTGVRLIPEADATRLHVRFCKTNTRRMGDSFP